MVHLVLWINILKMMKCREYNIDGDDIQYNEKKNTFIQISSRFIGKVWEM